MVPANLFSLVVAALAVSAEGDFPAVANSQLNPPALTTPAEALRALRVPDGFQVTLFAAEPAVRQPIALTTDARGRLWVAENYTYAEANVALDQRFRDRLTVLEDTNGDGTSDRRTVFCDTLSQLTSVEVGFGGVWAMCPPQLLFFPDRNGDDVPDGPPEVLLDGFDVGPANRHNFANGLKWGPDGWLYGRNGISNNGLAGRPGSPREQRVEIGPGIWRYHPVTRACEMVCQGTTNPWGHDWNEHGELFFINTVIGHLWHGVPGAHFKRMFGDDLNPYSYELLDQNADHVHWDSTEPWHQAKKGLSQSTDEAGGGHAHCGMMIYLGDNWPAAFRDHVYTLNMHGRRVNCDRLERQGTSYVGRHGADVLFSSDPWFRGTELLYGPDGGVFVADWSDVGECHENDGVHRTSGRIFKVTHGRLSPRPAPQLAQASNQELVALQLHTNEWYARKARLVLHERFRGESATAAGAEVVAQLRALFAEQASVPHKLRALLTLHVLGATSDAWLRELLRHENEHVRSWAVRLLVDQRVPSPAAIDDLASLGQHETSGLVRLYLASALQKLPPATRWPLADSLATSAHFADDRVLPLMIWYGVEGAVPLYPEEAAALATRARSPKVRQYIARRLTQALPTQPDSLERLLATLSGDTLPEVAVQRDVLLGISAGLRGLKSPSVPVAWSAVRRNLARGTDAEVERLVREISVVFGDGRAMEELWQLAAQREAAGESRRAAVRVLVAAQVENLAPWLLPLVEDRETAVEAIRGLATVEHAATPPVLLHAYAKATPEAQDAILATLAARPSFSLSLLAAVAEGSPPPEKVPLFYVRQMSRFDNAEVQRRMKQLWPQLRPVADEKSPRIAELKAQLTAEVLARANLSSGRALWSRSCAKCHVLFGEGGAIGPNLTGAQRGNLDYVLENVVDPSASLAPAFRMSALALKNGQTVTGVVLARTAETWEVQTPQERVSLPAGEIERHQELGISLMPEGQLDVLKSDEVRDLVAYLMSPRQVPLELAPLVPAEKPVP